MSGISSACPANLQKFASSAAQETSTLVNKINSLRQSYDQFQSSGGDFPVANPGLMDGALPQLAQTQQTTNQFTALTAQAFLNADSSSNPNAVITSPEARVNAVFAQLCKNAGIDPSKIESIPTALKATPTIAGAIPHDSGYVDDPICTATGHFTEVEEDFVMPPRLETLRWRRAYSSRLLENSGHGRGWWSWASVRLERRSETTLEYLGPDGRHGTFMRLSDGSWPRLPGVEADLNVGSDGWELAWDTMSDFPLQRWAFNTEGHIIEASGTTIASTRFTYHDDQLVSMTADGGRTLKLTWDEDRIVAISSSDGRSVGYSYNDRGDLSRAERAADPHRYETDETGLIVAVHDADGVRLCLNSYDSYGRVTEQVSPLGRETQLKYFPDRRTWVGDSSGGPAAIFEHDEIGRLTGVVNGEGRRFKRSFDERGRVIDQTDFNGEAWRLGAGGTTATRVSGSGGDYQRWQYDSAGRVVAHESPGGQATKFIYEGSSPLPIQIVDATGATTRCRYDDRGLLKLVTDADGVATQLSYNDDGLLVESRDAAEGITRFGYHRSGRVSSVTHPDGSTASIEWDDAGHLLAIIDEEGNTTSFEYTPAGRLATTVDPNGGRTTLEYDSTGEVVRALDPVGEAVEFRRDERASLVGLTNPDGSKWEFSYTLLGQLSMIGSPDGGVTSLHYDSMGAPSSHTDSLGQTTRMTYDEHQRLATFTDAAGGVWRYAYADSAGKPVSITDPSRAITTFEWDGVGRLLERRDPDGVIESYRYTAAGRIKEVSKGRVKRVFEYDGAGRVSEVTEGDASWRYFYDECHRISKIVTPEGRVTRIERDRTGRVTARVSGGSRVEVRYDAAGNVVASNDVGGAKTFGYDRAGHLLEATNATGGTVRYDYDAMGNVVATADPLGNLTKRRYDSQHRLLEVVDPLGRATRFAYDAAGQLTEKTSATGDRVTYRRTATGHVSDVLVNGDNVLIYDYDHLGRIVSAHDPRAARTETFGWSRAGQLVEWSDETASIAWEYGPEGTLRRRRDPNGATTTYDYDERGRLNRVESEPWGTIGVDHDNDGLLTSLDAPGWRRSWVYDDQGRLVGYKSHSGGRHIETTLAHDDAGRVVHADSGDSATSYRYDGAGRLVAANEDGDTTTWEYDRAGRRVAETRGDQQRTWAYDAAGQLTRSSENGESTEYHYDAAGRRVREATAKSERRYEWDALDRLRAVDDLRLDLDISGNPLSVGGHSLTWDPSSSIPRPLTLDGRSVLTIEGRLIGIAGEHGADWALSDWRGSVGPHDAWGKAANTSGSNVGLGFLGELEIDSLVWLRARSYDPATAQFLSPDPLAGVPGSAACAFPYGYANDDPIGFVDPLGLKGVPVSIDDFNKTRATGTSVQWGNIIAVGAAVGVALIAPVSLPAVLACGAAAGAVGGDASYITKGLAGQGWDTKGLIKGALIGGTVGAVTGGASKLVGKALEDSSLPKQILGQALVGSGGNVTNDGASAIYDSTKLPGSTHDPLSDISPGKLAFDATTGAGTGGLSGAMGHVKQPDSSANVPTTSGTEATAPTPHPEPTPAPHTASPEPTKPSSPEPAAPGPQSSMPHAQPIGPDHQLPAPPTRLALPATPTHLALPPAPTHLALPPGS